jgi:hypothetical protein
MVLGFLVSRRRGCGLTVSCLVILAYALPGAVALSSIGEGLSEFSLLMLVYTLASPSYLTLPDLRRTVIGLSQLVGD